MRRSTVAERDAILADPGFGLHFTDHMVDICWSERGGWHRPRVQPYGPITLDPAASVLHYGQEIFEGLKAYRHADGSIWSFRPDANARRLQRSAKRLALPELPEQYFIEALRQLIAIDGDWVPSAPETSLYLRPFMFAKEAFLGVRPAHKVAFYVIASPAGAYFHGGVKPVSIWLSTEYSRAGKGGTGAAKTGGNYAASLVAQAEAAEHGCAQVLFLDSVEGKWLEELGGMNVVLVYKDGTLVTPKSDSILEGITTRCWSATSRAPSSTRRMRCSSPAPRPRCARCGRWTTTSSASPGRSPSGCSTCSTRWCTAGTPGGRTGSTP